MGIRLFEIIKSHRAPIYFINSTLLSTAIGLITAILTYRYVSPEYLGIWVTLSTFTVYTTFFRLGIPNGMNRELPYYLGKNEINKANLYAETTLAYSLYITGILTLFSICFLLFYNFDKFGSLALDYKQSMLIISIIVITEPYSTFLSGTFRTSDNFKKLSDIQIIMSLMKIISVALVLVWGFQGFILRELILSLTNSLLLHLWRPMPHIRPKFIFSIFQKLFSVGFKIFLLSYTASFIETLPRLFLINEGSSRELGFFSPIIMMLGIIILIPNTLSSYLYPKFSHAYGANSDRLPFWKKIRLIYILSLIIAALASTIIYFSINYAIQLFPKYVDALPYIKLAGISVIFVGYKLGNILCVVFKEWKWLWSYNILYGVVQFITLRLFNVFFDDSLKGVIMSLTLTYMIMFFYSYYLTYKITHKKDY